MIEISADVKTLKRLRVATVVLFVFGAVVGIRLFQLQIIQHRQLLAKSEQQYVRTLRLEPKRGAIYDANMKELAASVPVNSLYVNPPQVSNPAATAALIAPILEMSTEKLVKKLSLPKSFVWLKRKMPPAQAEKIASLNLRSLGFVQENKRYYPKRTLAGQLLGFVGTDNKGLEGLEFMYNGYIGGSSSLVLVEKDAKGRKIYTSKRPLREGTKGLDILLNIDETIQYLVEKELDEQVTRSRARGGVVIVMDPHTGNISALAQNPPFNPNSFRDYKPARWKRSAVTDTFEPGSTFKIVTLSAAIEEGLSSSDDLIYAENGSFAVGGRVFKDIHKYRWLTVREVMVKSSNIGAIKLGLRVGSENQYNYIRRFGFGSKTGIDLPGESAGLIRAPQDWSRDSNATLSFGYEISVTPIQLITAYAAIANGGMLVRPRLVKGVMNEGRLTQEFPLLYESRVISRKTARMATSILKDVVEIGTGKNAAIPGYQVAGKTGTTKKFDPVAGVYSSTRYIATFVGFFPADDPKVVILVLIDEPQNGYYASATAAPAFSKIGSQVARYLKIPNGKNLLTASALIVAEESTSGTETGISINNVFKRIDRGLKNLMGKAKESIMGPMHRKIANRKRKS